MNPIANRSLSVLLVALLATALRADPPDPPEPTADDLARLETQSAWVQRVRSALTQLGTGNAADALQALQAIDRDLPDHDTDGTVALTIGDCYLRLGDYEQAERQYQAVAQAHPDQADLMWVRLVELDLARGNPASAETRLRQVLANTPDPQLKSWALWRLAMTQEQQAIDLLTEAKASYRQAFEDGTTAMADFLGCRADRHAADLDDAVAQLTLALRDLQRATIRTAGFGAEPSAGPTTSAAITTAKLAGTLTRPDSQQPAVQISIDENGTIAASIDHRDVALNDAVKQQIKKHLNHVIRLVDQDQ